MKTAIAIFVKTPGVSPLKTRLAAGIGEDAALQFYDLSVSAIRETLKDIDVKPYWAIAEKSEMDNSLWQGFRVLHTGEGGLGARQHHVYETLLKHHDHVLLIGADAPQISKLLIEQAVSAFDTHDFVIGPAHDGGYYLFGGCISTEARIWNSVSWSVDTTREELETQLPSTALHLPALTDIDEKEDLGVLIQEMPDDMNQNQQHLLEWIKAL